MTPKSTSVERRVSLIVAQWKLFDSGELNYGLDSLTDCVEKDRKSGKLCLRIPRQDLITDFNCMVRAEEKC